MILLTVEEMDKLWKKYEKDDPYQETPWGEVVAKEQLKKALIGIGKVSNRMNGTTYLIPDYIKYREALKEVV